MKKQPPKVFTYQSRLVLNSASNAILDLYGVLYGKVERTLFTDLQKGKELNTLKREYLLQFGITARQFNGCRITLQGKIESVKECCLLNIEELKDKIAALEKKLPKIRCKFKKHFKHRKLVSLKQKLASLELEKEKGQVSLCFGGKKLFHAQYNLEKNGYRSLEEWKKDWEQARNSEFFCIGSSDETAGNQSCVLTFNKEGKATLFLRLPNCFIESYGKYLQITEIDFAYGQKEIIEALATKTALSYRFKKDKKGWRVFVSLAREGAKALTTDCNGAIGLDVNSDHLALVETDKHGNPIDKKTIPLVTYGKTKAQAQAMIGDACKEVIALCKEKGKILVIEQLDFKKKKITLKDLPHKLARMLSSFSYGQVLSGLERKGFCEGVEVHSVNPAMTSIIGRIKFSKRYGLSSHHGAALCIARRYYGFTEAPSKSTMVVVYKNAQVTCLLPERKRGQHVWAFWKKANEKLKAALAVHSRASFYPSNR